MVPREILIFFILAFFSGCNFLEKKQAEPQSPTPSFSLQANAELLREMLYVVYQKEPKNVQEFLDFKNALDQGASIEGIYNGLTHSSRYRKYELSFPQSRAMTLKVFTQELWNIEVELPDWTEFTAKSAKPLEVFKPNEIRDLILPTYKSPHTTEYYSRIFSHASHFTLKRILGDEALKLIDSKKKNKSELDQWYGKWVVKLAQRNVDFGLELRNKQDEEFHTQWADSASEDRIKWEVLNRVHRLLNEETHRE